MRQFIDHPFPVIEQINSDNGRRYKVPSGELYPSVTTVLSSKESPELDAWRESIGQEEARRVGARAGVKGSKVHEACENMLLGKETKWGMFDGEARNDFSTFIPVIENISIVHAIEKQMFSDKLKVAGTVDLICEYQGKLCILDWKTSRRVKDAEEITSYFMQMSVYALMFWEHTGIAIPHLCVQMTIDGYGLKTFWETPKKWIPQFIELRNKFKEERGF